MNLLSIGAAYGVIVAVFQWGWVTSLIGIGKEGPIEAWVPMMLFAIVFGLSMDYEVFLLSRIREEYDRTERQRHGGRRRPRHHGAGHHRRRRDHGLRVRSLRARRPAGRSSSSGSASPSRCSSTRRSSGMVLVPATMELLGDRNWWFPKWLSRVTPRIGIEESHEAITPRAPLEPEPARD